MVGAYASLVVCHLTKIHTGPISLETKHQIKLDGAVLEYMHRLLYKPTHIVLCNRINVIQQPNAIHLPIPEFGSV